MKKTGIIAFALLLGLALSGVLSFGAQEAPEVILNRMSRTFAGMASFQADFEQSSYSPTVSAPLRQKGRVYFRRPDAMRWEYAAPEKNIYVFKDGLLLSYFPEDNQLWRQAIPKEKYEAEILGLLTGKSGWAERYIVEDSPFPGGGPALAQLKLTPREEGETAYFLLEIERRSGLLRRAIFFDWGGTKSEFGFSRLKSGVRLADALFEIKVPPDCEIIDDAAPVKR